MEPISKSDMDFLIKHNIIKCVKGRYIGMITGSKEKHGRNKPRWIQPDIYEQWLKLKEQLKVDK